MKLRPQNPLKKRDEYRVFILSEQPATQSRILADPAECIRLIFSQTLPPPHMWDVAVLPVKGLAVWSRLIKAFPVICTGNPELAWEAHAAGCIDYLTDGYTTDELYYRILKFIDTLPKGISLIPEQLKSKLNHQEKVLLELLLSKKDTAVHRKAMQLYLWGEIRPGSRGIDMHITQLRRKCRHYLSENEMLIIKTVHGCGYLVSN